MARQHLESIRTMDSRPSPRRRLRTVLLAGGRTTLQLRRRADRGYLFVSDYAAPAVLVWRRGLRGSRMARIGAYLSYHVTGPTPSPSLCRPPQARGGRPWPALTRGRGGRMNERGGLRVATSSMYRAAGCPPAGLQCGRRDHAAPDQLPPASRRWVWRGARPISSAVWLGLGARRPGDHDGPSGRVAMTAGAAALSN